MRDNGLFLFIHHTAEYYLPSERGQDLFNRYYHNKYCARHKQCSIKEQSDLLTPAKTKQHNIMKRGFLTMNAKNIIGRDDDIKVAVVKINAVQWGDMVGVRRLKTLMPVGIKVRDDNRRRLLKSLRRGLQQKC